MKNQIKNVIKTKFKTVKIEKKPKKHNKLISIPYSSILPKKKYYSYFINYIHNNIYIYIIISFIFFFGKYNKFRLRKFRKKYNNGRYNTKFRM